ncbi:MAG TPA: hypothetical protein VN873_04120 [Candidatus Angelobacter sp.]|nr:hypothetical protein [Candidatus Angelobacter sp.]
MIDALHVGVAAGSNARELVQLLGANHHNPGVARAFFTGILSVLTPENAAPEVLADMDSRIERAVRDLSAKLGVPMVAWIHGNTKTRHAHLLFPNSDGNRTLPMPRKFLQDLQGFGWTTALASGRGKGERQASPVFTRAKKLQVRDLATLLVDEDGKLRDDRWEELEGKGEIGNPRHREDGSPISFEYQGRRIRFATLQGFVGEQQRKTRSMTNHTNLGQPVPPALLAQLAEVGVNADAVNRVVEQFRDIKRAVDLDRETKLKNIPQPPKIGIE